MAIKIPTTTKVEEVAEDMDLFGFQIDKQSINASVEFGNTKDGSFEQFEFRSFYANYSSLKVILEQKVLGGTMNADEAVAVKASIEATIDELKDKAMLLLLKLHNAGLINIPEKVSRWVEPKSTS